MNQKVGRPPIKRNRALVTMIQKIVSGAWPSGHRLPSRLTLQRLLHVDSRTLERAFLQLGEDGFVVSRHRVGSFVADHPPHLSRIALTFPYSPEEQPGQFYRALRLEAGKIQSEERQIEIFQNIDSRHDVPDYARLEGWVQRHALVGLIFASHPAGLSNDPILTEPLLPRVYVESDPVESGLPTVWPDTDGFLPRACEWLAARGRRRVAVLDLAGYYSTPERLERQMAKMASVHGFTVEPRWIQGLASISAPWAGHLVSAMLHGSRGGRPDALVVTDDNLVPNATAGVVMAGRKPGVDLDVVAHANFPHVTPSAVPARRLGFETRAVLDACIERLRQQRVGDTPPGQTRISAVWEEERGECGRT